MPESREDYAAVCMLINEIMHDYHTKILIVIGLLSRISIRKRKRRGEAIQSSSMINKMPSHIKHLNRIVGVSNTDCILNLRMDRNCFGRLCLLLRETGGLIDENHVSAEEQVAMFLGILARTNGNRIVGVGDFRSDQTVPWYVHAVLRAILTLHELLLVKPDPVPEDSTDGKWKWFKGCLGALDSIYINVKVPDVDKPRYRSRKGEICTNTLAVCDHNLKFAYVLAGWEGSASDSRVLQDAVTRKHGLQVPRGNYYLCDSVYANREGFLAPYRGVRRHLKEWGLEFERPQNPQEMFNMRHSEARNVIDRASGILKMRWGILRSGPYYPFKLHNRLVMSCFLLHNFIRNEMQVDPVELEMDEAAAAAAAEIGAKKKYGLGVGFVGARVNSSEWNRARDAIAEKMWMCRGTGSG